MSAAQAALIRYGATRRRARSWVRPMVYGKTGDFNDMYRLAGPDCAFGTRAELNAFHNAGLYTHNPGLWCSSLVPQLTCVPIAKDDCGTSSYPAGGAWHARYGWVAVTRRHVLGTGHALTHAQGTWGYNGNSTNSPPTRIRFLTAEGEVVDRVQLGQVSFSSSHNYDAGLAVLDADLPDSIHVIPLAAPNLSRSLSRVDWLICSQEWRPDVNAEKERYHGPTPPDPCANWSPWLLPWRHRQLVHTSRLGLPSDAGYGFRYPVWGGDSGTPAFFNDDGILSLSGIISGRSPSGPPLNEPGYFQNGRTPQEMVGVMIDAADDYAISLGRMSVRTNYRPTVLPDIKPFQYVSR